MDFQATGITHTRVLQIQMEELHANFHQLPLLKQYFDGLFPTKEIHEDMDDDEKRAIKQFWSERHLAICVTSMVCLYKRLPLEALVNLFRHEPAQLIASCAEALVRGRWLFWDDIREEFVTPQLPHELNARVFNRRYPMPMLHTPNILFNEKDSPYLTEQKSQSVLGEYNGQRTNLDTLNALNQIPLRINAAVAQHAPDPFKDDDKFRRDSATVFHRIRDDTFYLTWQFDFRGRVYARGYHVNPQGDDWHKHVVQFGE